MRAQVKQWAKEHRDGNKWNIWQVILVVGIITGATTGIVELIFPGTPENPNTIASLLNTVIEFALVPLTIGQIVYIVNIVRGKKFELGQIFSKYSDFLRIFVSDLLVGVFVFLFTLLLIVPGIIRAISYFLVNYILADDDFKDLSATEILDLSRKLMDGHKTDYFVMSLYYFGMMLLGCFTLGILWIWVIPEMNLAYVKFATELLDEYKKENKIEAKKEEKEEAKEEKAE